MPMIPPFYKQKRAGFTLIELMVAVALFASVATISAGAYVVTINLSNRAHAVALTVDNLAFVIENMTRSIRTGTDYKCLDNPAVCHRFEFKDPSNRKIQYYFDEGAQRITQKIESGSEVSLTDTQIQITELVFDLVGDGNTPSNYEQPFVRMYVKGEAQAESGKKFNFSLQTAATMRGIDL